MAISIYAVWRIRLPATGVSNLNGGGFDPSIAGAGTDYSQQNSAQLIISDLQCLVADDAGRLKIRSATGGFTAAMIGNAINIAVTGTFDQGHYFITGYTSGNVVTLDRSPAAGVDRTGGAARVGGAFADYSGCRQTGDPLRNPQSYNKIYIMGSGNPSATPDYTWNSTDWGQNGCNYRMVWLGEPGTMPHIRASQGAWIVNSTGAQFGNLYFSAGGNAYYQYGVVGHGASAVFDCIVDQNGWDVIGINGGLVWGCEVFNSQASADGAQTGLYIAGGQAKALYCYVHDCRWNGIYVGTGAHAIGCISAKNRGVGIYYNSLDGNYFGYITGCTIDGNLQHGIQMNFGYSEIDAWFMNNLITNHTGSGMYGIYVMGSASTATDKAKQRFFGTIFYNNTTHVSSTIELTDGDRFGTMMLTGDPYIDAAHNDYSVNTLVKEMALPRRNWFSSKAGQTAFRSYMDMGAVQRQEPIGGGGGGGGGSLIV